MMDFLVRFFGVMTAGVFLIATFVGVVSNFLGFHFGNSLEDSSKKILLEQNLNRKSVEMEEKTLATDLTASIYQLDKKIEVQDFEAGVDVVSENNIVEDIKLTLETVDDLEMLLEDGDVMVLLDNSVLESFLYTEKQTFMTKVVSVYDDYVETTKGGMDFKGGSIYTKEDFFKAFNAAGKNFELFSE